MRYLTQLCRAAVAALVIAFALSASATAVSAQTVYDAVNDFSIESSSGVWSYGYTTTRGSQFVNYNQAQANIFSGFDIWNMAGNGANPQSIWHNATSGTLIYSTITHPADVLNLHPGPNGENSVVRWTAQAAGMYQVKGGFQRLDFTTTDVAVLHNSGSDPLFSGSIANGTTDEVMFTRYVYVEAGDTIDFTVGFGSNNSYNNDSTGLAATIRPFVISGRVMNEGGNGIGGTQVTLRSGVQWATTTTDADGRYSFERVSVGRDYTITAHLTDCERRRFRFVPASYTFRALNDPQTADFVRTAIECPPKTICRDEPPCPL